MQHDHSTMDHLEDIVDLEAFNTLEGHKESQQDAGEAIHLWLHHLACELTDMGWHLRGVHDILDSGGFRMPVHLTMPQKVRSKLRLQSLVKRWTHDSRGRQALVSPPPILCVHINRFTSHGHRRQDKIYWDFDSFQLENGDFGWAHYKIVSGILHYGDTPASGHSQSFYSTRHGSYML